MPTEPAGVRAYIALGSNLDDPLQQVESAVQQLADLPQTTLLRTSPWYRSVAIGPGDQPDYVNGVALLSTQLDPHTLFAHCQRIEAAHGRERRVRWAARTLDLDILLYGDQQITSEQLTVPHPRLTERNFVIYPLADVDPELVLPGGVAIATLKAQTSAEGLEPWG